MPTRMLLLPLFAVLLTSCESYREQYFTGQIKTDRADYQLVRIRAPEGSSRTTLTTAEWNYYPEGVSRILAIRSPRQQNYSGFQISCPSNSFGVYLLRKRRGPLDDSTHDAEIVLQGRLVFRNDEGTAFDVNAQSADEAEAINGSMTVKRHWEFHPMLPFVGLAMMFGAGGATTVPRPAPPPPSAAPKKPESKSNNLEENGGHDTRSGELN